MFRRLKSLLANEEENLKRMEKEEFEKGDTLALILAALITFVPALILVLGLFVLIIWLIFG